MTRDGDDTILSVPDELHRLTDQAAAAGLSLSEYRLRDLSETADRPMAVAYLLPFDPATAGQGRLRLQRAIGEGRQVVALSGNRRRRIPLTRPC